MNNFIDLENMQSMDELFGKSENSALTEGKIITGRVAMKKDNGILLDIGCKAESFIPDTELGDKWETIKAGDELEVFVEPNEDDGDMPNVSLKKAELQKSWDSIEQNYQEGDVIKGIIRSRVKGGLIVDVNGVEAFLPGSLVDLITPRNLDDYLGREEEFKIMKIVADRRNIVLSRRDLLEADRAKKRAELLAELKPMTIRHGVVKNITDFGAFVDLNGMDGLLHITDMSWTRIKHPSEVVKVGDEIDVMILDVDTARQRVSLGLKQKDGNPWDTIDVKYPKGSRVKGKVVNVMPYGAFVQLEDGIEGLIHISEMSWTKKVTKANDIVKEGDEVEAVVLEVSKENHKISLSMRQCQENPWKIIKERYPKGTHIKGKVRNMTGYGAFVQIQDDIDGMIHVSDMSWIRKVNNPSEILQKGMEVEAVILDVDDVGQRISLSMKKLTDDPWQTIQNKYKVGDIVEGKVTKQASFGAFVELEGGIDGLIHFSELSDEHVTRVKDVVNVGDIVRVRVKNINTEERRIGLSLRDVDGTHSAPAPAQGRSDNGSDRSNDLGDLGNILDAALEDKAVKDEASDKAE